MNTHKFNGNDDTGYSRLEPTLPANPYEQTIPYELPPIPPPPKVRRNWLRGIAIIGHILIVLLGLGIFGLVAFYAGRISTTGTHTTVTPTQAPLLTPTATIVPTLTAAAVPTPAIPTNYTASAIINDFTANGLPVSQVNYSISLNHFLDGWTTDDAHGHSESAVTTQPESSVFFRDPTVCVSACDTQGDTFLAVYNSTGDAQSSLAQVKSWTEYVNNCHCGPHTIPNNDIQQGRCLLITNEPFTSEYAQIEDKYCI
jgi:hypothetical protein